MPPRSNEFRNNTLPSLPPQPHSTFISFSLRLCPGWIDFTLFGFDNHVYCAMKCGVAEGWQYPSTRGNLLTAGARWRYSLAQERSAHSDTTASVCATGSLAEIYDASRAITLSLTLIQQFIYCHACIRAEVSFLQRGGGVGGGGKCLQSARVTSIVSQETSHVTLFSRGKQMKHRVFSPCCRLEGKCRRSLWCCWKQLKWRSMTTSPPEPRRAGAAGRRLWGTKWWRYQTGLKPSASGRTPTHSVDYAGLWDALTRQSRTEQ